MVVNKSNDFQTDWAFDESFTKHVHISEAKSGLNGYFCLGCKKELQAVKGSLRVHYFRHDAKDVNKDYTECVVANRNYRERIARDILQRLKELKVPAVFKFPPNNIDGAPNLLKHSETITAHYVKSELTFYEDDNCKIQFGKNPLIDERYLLIRPDIAFFNRNNEPILLVEFVVTHKINNEKRVKLKRLGLNTVQIIIPKKPEPEIEKALKSSSKVKWIFNETEANSNYIFIPKSNDNGIWSFDDDQRRIFEESYRCRASQIKNLIRTVKRALESQSYKRTEQLFEFEISRIEGATKTAREGLEEMEDRIDEEIRNLLAGEFEKIDREENEFEEEEDKFQQKVKDLETRYYNKKRELDQEQANRSKAIREHSDIGEASERTRAEFRIKEIEIERDSNSIKENITRIRKRIEQLPKEFKQLEIQAQGSFERDREGLEYKRRDLQSKIESFGTFIESEEEKFRREFEELGKQTTERINKRDCSGNSELSKRIESILHTRRLSSDFKERQITYKRYKAYLEIARSGSAKKR